jgi:hypothetical protein
MNNLLETAHSSGASRRKFCHKTVPLSPGTDIVAGGIFQ